jgi:hypothetical protein
MALVISVHEYELKPDVDEAAFENAIRDAERRGLFNLPGLTSHYFLRGFKGHRRGTYAALWIFESAKAWESLWGPADCPKPAEEYPESWKIWEREILASFLKQDPDTIRFTTYAEISRSCR